MGLGFVRVQYLATELQYVASGLVAFRGQKGVLCPILCGVVRLLVTSSVFFDVSS